MCGIAGIYLLNRTHGTLRRGLLERMGDSMAHRGPDDRGTIIKGRAGLSHRRLSILDLLRGHQPMGTTDGNVWISYNGEIYNYKELQNALSARGVRFRTNTDTEVILESYRIFGISCVKRLQGMFAFALFDAKQQRLYLVRDRLGIKPLHYKIERDRVIFGSESKAILIASRERPLPDARAIADYLSYRQPLGDRTFFTGIKSVPAGCMLIADVGRTSLKRYWELPAKPPAADKGEMHYRTELKQRLDETVRNHTISDVPVGAYLSGGLDSSIVVAAMSCGRSEPMHTFSIGFRDKGYEEFKYSRLMAKRYGTKHHEIRIGDRDYLDLIPRLIKFNDAPLSVPNEIPLFLMSRALKKHITVVLSGEGADELFGGYGRIFRSPFELMKRHRMREVSSLTKLGIFGDERVGLRQRTPSLVDHFLDRYSLLRQKEKASLLVDHGDRFLRSDPLNRRFFAKLFMTARGLSAYDKYLWIFEKVHLQNLLRRLDMTTMAASVEGRVPFVDHRLVEFGMSMPIQYKLRWKSRADFRRSFGKSSDDISERHDITKYILRTAYRRTIPARIIQRRKVGFPVPLGRMFGQAFHGFAQEILLDTACIRRGIFRRSAIEELLTQMRSNPSQKLGIRIWMLLNVELWCRDFFD